MERRITSDVVLSTLFELFISRGAPEHVRSDNGSEFTAKAVWKWLTKMGCVILFIEPGSPWENGYVETFNGKMRDEPLNGEMFDTLLEAKVIVGEWVKHYNKVRPHYALGQIAEAKELTPTRVRHPARGLRLGVRVSLKRASSTERTG